VVILPTPFLWIKKKMIFDVTFNKTDGGLGRTLAGDDAVSGLVYGIPTTVTYSGEQGKVFYSQKEVEAFSGFAPTAYATLKYHTAQFFKMVAAPLYIAIGGAEKIAQMQTKAGGKIKQVGVLSDANSGEDEFDTPNVEALQSVADALAADYQGLSIIYSPNILTDLNGLPDLTELECPNVSVVVGKSLGRTDKESHLGLTLGTVALSKVSENIGYVEKFNVVDDGEFDALAFITGDAYTDVTITFQNALQAKGYIFLRKYVGFAGSYHTDSNTATASTSDYSRIENVRTMEKATRSIRTALVPKLGAPLKLKGGKLAYETVTNFELLVKNRLEQMQNADEISEFSVRIDPDQNVLSTSVLEIEVVIVPLGVARQIKVNIGFAVKAS
jgi:hypothetical protein